ncbi:Ig-like domain-containing protein [Rhodococcus spongiicola]|uniref:Ig-like domain-containing protein n=1 Tax=Rhodococcus spongiicola TaxID=2487352 RepID=UPI001F2CC9E6|nr:Ig-like domain-containing protein [Rhodococcus spongiicola]
MTNKLYQQFGGVVTYIYWVKDIHPPCLKFQSAKVDGKSYGASTGADYAQVDGSIIQWPIRPIANPRSRTFEFTYKVGSDCERDIAMNTGMGYNASIGGKTWSTKGPKINVPYNSTTTTLTAPANMQVGESAVLEATVTGGARGDNVDFYDGGVKIGTAQLNDKGVAKFHWTPGAFGRYSMNARFPATPRALASFSTVVDVTVSPADTVSSTVLAPVVGAQVGQASVLRATVAPTGSGGTVEFTDGGEALANVPVGADGVATYTWVPSTAGDHTIAATFSGSAGVTGSSDSATVNVAAAPVDNIDSRTVLTIGPIPTVGVAQTITADVTPGDAGGTVTFKDGDTVIGISSVDSSGRATLEWTPAHEGQRNITAQYSGAGNVNGSADEITVVVGTVPGGGDNGGGTGSAGSLFGSSGSSGS